MWSRRSKSLGFTINPKPKTESRNCFIFKDRRNTHTKRKHGRTRRRWNILNANMDDDKEEEEDDVVFSSRLKSVLLNAPKELSRAMFDFASSAKFALTTTTKTRTRRIIIESHDEEEEENEEEEEEERGGKGVTLRSSPLRERLQPFITSSSDDAEERRTSAWFLEQLNERVVKRVLVEMTTSMVSKKENNLEEEEEDWFEAVVEKVVESSFAFTTKKEEEEDEEDEKKARVRLKKILRSRAKEWFEKTMTLTNSSQTREGRKRRLRVGTPRLVEYDWTAYATRASSSLESLTLNASSASSVSSASRLRLSLRVSKEEEEEEEEHQHHRLDLDLDSLSVLVDALRDAKVAVVAASGGNM